SGIRTVAYFAWAETSRAALAAGRTHPGQSFAGAALTELTRANYAWHVQPGVHIHQLAALTSGGVGMGSALPSMRFYGYYPLR
ncbi:hypothetical protein, partial [Escherichia coli]|uniref:hypothetical protein n=1 Tax=Escherichia coli TaxID=562 RepID=UPI0013D17CAD